MRTLAISLCLTACLLTACGENTDSDNERNTPSFEQRDNDRDDDRRKDRDRDRDNDRDEDDDD